MQSPDLKDYFQARGIQVENLADVQDYLRQFPDMLPVVAQVSELVRTAFGTSTGMSLALYSDAEANDRFLTLYIRQFPYADGLMDEIESFTEKSRPLLAGTSGRMVISTDLHPIG